MANPSQAIAAQAAAALAELPPCVVSQNPEYFGEGWLCADYVVQQTAALEVIVKTPCGPDIACVCEKIGFGFIAQLSKSPSIKNCSPVDIEGKDLSGPISSSNLNENSHSSARAADLCWRRAISQE